MGERVHRSVMNVKVGVFFFALSLLLAFFSRKVMLDCLGAEFIGLTGTLMNIISFLSVAELGIGTSIVYFLYKPLQEDNHDKVNEVMSMLAYLYRWIGYIIGIIGFVVSLFFPLWFNHLHTGLFLVYFAFYAFLASSMAGYILNFKQLLVGANQKQYIVHSIYQSITIVQSVVQILVAYYTRNLYLWVAVYFISTIIGVIIFNYKIKKLYPWLKVDFRLGRQNLKKYPEVLKKTRQVFVQKMKNFLLYRSDEILVGAFVSVVQVAFYGNYTIITNKLNFLVNILSDGMNAGVGNLIAEGNDKNTMKVFWELIAIRFLLLGVVIFALLMFIQPFIICWVGAEYRLSDIVVYLLLLNLFVHLFRGVIEMFISACGLFQDVWAAWTELIVNLVVTFCLAPFLGIVGILLGKVVSMFFIEQFWKPYFLFKQGLHKDAGIYWRGVAPFYLFFSTFCAIAIVLKLVVIDPRVDTIPELIGYGLVIYSPLVILYFVCLFVFTRGMKYFVARKPAVYNRLGFLRLSSFD